MKIQTILYILIGALIIIVGLPVAGAYFFNWRAEYVLEEDMRKMGDPRMEMFKRKAKEVIVDEYDLPVDMENQNQAEFWRDSETNSMGADFYYTKELNFLVTKRYFDFEIHVGRSWPK